jgi:hypothetical protein
MINRFWYVALLLSFVSVAAIANAETIRLDFDDLTPGDQLEDQFINKGVIFSGTAEGSLGTSGVVGTEPDFGTFFFGNSEPNFVIVGDGSLTARFIDPDTQSPSIVSNVKFRMGDGDFAAEVIGVNAFDRNGKVIFATIVHLLQEGTTINIRRDGIAEIRMFGFQTTAGSGFAIDDFSYFLGLRNRDSTPRLRQQTHARNH